MSIGELGFFFVTIWTTHGGF